jgi:energy-converting hydrogenase Eha subunit A
MSGRIQTFLVFIWCSVTYSMGFMAHLDYSLAEQVVMHIGHTVVLLGIAAMVAAAVPTRSPRRFYLQTSAIVLTAMIALHYTLVFNS